MIKICDATLEYFASLPGEMDPELAAKECQSNFVEYRQENECHGYDYGNAWRKGANWAHDKARAWVGAAITEGKRMAREMTTSREIFLQDKVETLEAENKRLQNALNAGTCANCGRITL